ncbi:MAG: hypothetical protein WDM77_10270 [Steroidobacteraceae bacterium]
MDDPQVRKFVLRLLLATRLSFSAAGRARRFIKVAGIPGELRGAADPPN